MCQLCMILTLREDDTFAYNHAVVMLSVYLVVVLSILEILCAYLLLPKVITIFSSPGVPAGEIYSKIQSGYRLPKPSFCSEKIYKIMAKCWDDDAEMRPTFQYLHRVLEQSLEYQSPSTQC